MFKKASRVFGSLWFHNIMHFLFSFSLVKFYAAEGRGIYAMLIAYASIFATFLGLGLQNAALFHHKHGSVAVRTSLWIYGVQGIVGTFLVLWVGHMLGLLDRLISYAGFTGDVLNSQTYLLISTLFVLNAYFNLFIRTILLGIHDTRSFRNFIILPITAVTAFMVITNGFMNVSLGLLIVLHAGIETLFNVYFSIRLIRLPPADNETTLGTRVGMLYRYGMQNYISIIANSLFVRLDTIITGSYISVAGAGYYAVAKYFYNALMSVPQSIGGMLFGSFSENTDKKALLHRSMRGVFFSMAAVVLIILIFGPFMVRLLFGQEFIASVPVLILLSFAALLLGTSNPIQAYLLGRGFPAHNSIVSMLSGGVKILLLFLLVKAWGFNGVGFAMLFGGFTVLAFRTIAVGMLWQRT